MDPPSTPLLRHANQNPIDVNSPNTPPSHIASSNLVHMNASNTPPSQSSSPNPTLSPFGHASPLNIPVQRFPPINFNPPIPRYRPSTAHGEASEFPFGSLAVDQHALSNYKSAHDTLQSWEKADVSTLSNSLNTIQSRIQSFNMKITEARESSKSYQTKSSLSGWGVIIGLGSFAVIAMTRFRSHISGMVSVGIISGTLVFTAACGYIAVRAENSRLNADAEVTLWNQFLPSLEHSTSQHRNVLACKAFYEPAPSIQELMSGEFFSRKARLFDTRFKLTPRQTERLSELHDEINSMRPLPRDVSTALTMEIAALTVYHSNRIERVGLGLSETEIIIRGLHAPSGQYSIRNLLETWTHAKALAIVIEFVRTGVTRANFRPSQMMELHRCLMAECPEACPGMYRKDPAFIASNPDQVLASPPEIESLVEGVFQYINESRHHDLEVIVNVHAWLVRIHPFADGNGRVIRLVTTFLALSSSYTGIAFTGETDEYFAAIRDWDQDPQVFGSLVVQELEKMSKVYTKAYSDGEGLARSKANREFVVIQ